MSAAMTAFILFVALDQELGIDRLWLLVLLQAVLTCEVSMSRVRLESVRAAHWV